MRPYFQHTATVAALALILAACGGGLDDVATETTAPAATTEPSISVAPPDETTTTETTSTTISPVAPPEGPSALDAAPNRLTGEGFPEPLIDTDRLLQGQVPDGIPAIDTPRFVRIDAADEWLSDDEAVVILDINGDVRAYPIQIMMWHEIVNDTVGDVPVAITYCPLCNSAVSYERRVDGHLTTFGTSGFLFNSALVMYDRATESLWTHFDGTAVAGVRTGTRLEPISSPLLAWADFKNAHPDGLVLDVERTGHSRPYGSNPYSGYDNPESFPFLFDGEVDDRATAKQRVVGVNVDGFSMAWTLEAISGDRPTTTHATVGDNAVVVFWKPGQASALDSSGVAAGRDVGSVRVFRPQVESQSLTFEPTDDGFVDAETGSEWNILGEAINGSLAGEKLEPVAHLDTFWFAWLSYNPATEFMGS